MLGSDGIVVANLAGFISQAQNENEQLLNTMFISNSITPDKRILDNLSIIADSAKQLHDKLSAIKG